jgi:diadenosine tetraphosphate (Ap4A) HIT family hydrolase
MMRERLLEEDPTTERFNMEMNSGKIAGQTILHCHLHLIPRRKGDVGMKGLVREATKHRMRYGE